MPTSFEGLLWLLSDPEGAVPASVAVDDTKIYVSSRGSEIGNWMRSDVEVTTRGANEYLFRAEGEDLVFQTTAGDFLGATRSSVPLTDRIRAAQTISTGSASGVDSPPPSHRTLSQWWVDQSGRRKAWIGGAAALVAVVLLGSLNGGASDDSSPRITIAQVTSESSREPTQARSTTGDWPSESAYVDDVVDTSDKMATLMETFAEASFSVGDGTISLSQFVGLMDTAITSAESHRDYFLGTTAPDRYGTAHGYLIQALGIYVDALETAQRGAENADVGTISQASALLERGNEAMNRAADSLPSG